MVRVSFNSLGYRMDRAPAYPAHVNAEPSVVYPATYFDKIRDGLEYLDQAAADEAVTKERLIEEVRSRLAFLLRKLLAAPTSTGFSVFRDPVRT